MRVKYMIIYVSDMERSISFYRDVLGIPLKFESPGWTELVTDGATLVLHRSDGLNPDASEHQMERAGTCGAGFQVPNLEEYHTTMIEQNVPCAREPIAVFGAMVAQYVDPDGLIISVGEERSS